MIERTRRFFRDQPVGIAVPVGFIVVYAMWQLISSLVGGILYPIVLTAFTSDETDFRLDFHMGGIRFDATAPFINGVTFLVLLPVLYFVFARVVPTSSDQDWDLRECPECKSDIFSDATRCAFCTSAVPPIEIASDV